MGDRRGGINGGGGGRRPKKRAAGHVVGEIEGGGKIQTPEMKKISQTAERGGGNQIRRLKVKNNARAFNCGKKKNGKIH